MTTITFYRQARRDGGIRTGIEINGNTALSRFDDGTADSDPALLWYVDVKCSGKSLPVDPEEARGFLIRHETQIRQAISGLADEIPAGVDPDAWPVRRTARAKAGFTIEVACSAVRRLEAVEIAQRLREVAMQWRDLVERFATGCIWMS